ncbi:MAG: DNA methyltransferase, partial [Acidobacteria bacterium]|nr:DNA methyltransferase [Acidobacteriota bacterium]
AGFFPMYLKPKRGIKTLHGSEADQPGTVNLSRRAFTVASEIGTGGPVPFYHTLAILHSPNYRREHGAALRQDWPRVPIPATQQAFVNSADLGFRVAAELAIEWEWETYAEGPRPRALDPLARLSREGGGALDPDGGELEVTAGWGRAGKAGAIMPGRGRLVERGYTEEERSAMGSATGQLGETTFDVYLNDSAYWKNIPSRVWGYTLGGYQVIKKWLSYRERSLLGRALTVEDTLHVQEMTRRIGGILLMEPALDANYEAVKRGTYPCQAVFADGGL